MNSAPPFGRGRLNRWEDERVQHETWLSGYGLALRPLVPLDASALFGDIDPDFWRGMTTPVPRSVDELADNFSAAVANPTRMAFAVVDEMSTEIVGTTSYYDVVPHRLEIGHTFYARRVWGSHVNPAAKFLLLAYAFETLNVARVALRCDARNARSRAAIERLGASFEGILRKHRTASDGVLSDTAYYSVLDDEWAQVRAGLLARLGQLGIDG